MNKRGVGILISDSLNAVVEQEYTDKDENILGLLVLINGIRMKLCSIYGPNHNDKVFYDNLGKYLSVDTKYPVVIGGDWNTSYSTADNPLNPDIMNMCSPPSTIRSGWLADLCRTYDLTDPFRALHPTRRDFSFSPAGRRLSRSRLDFFVISSALLSNLRKCEISPSISSTYFDHKSILLDFTRNKVQTKPYINRTITDNPRTSDTVLAAFADTYLAHADPIQPADDLQHVFRAADVDAINPQKVIVGRFMLLLREYNDLIERHAREESNPLLPLLIAEKNTEITLQRELLWDVQRYQNLKLTCNAAFFLEALVSNIKGAVISFQCWTKKTENLKKSILIARINRLRNDYMLNVEEIIATETKLSSILNAELLAKVKSMKLFNCLNSEKPTPIFLNLARSNNSSKTLALINKPDGTPYSSDNDRNEGIVSFFEEIYRKSPNDLTDYTNCIEDFLGDVVLSNPIVTNSKLTRAEHDLLEAPLTVDELDLSIEKCNVRSAPGIDGLNNYFIKKFWHLLRIPLLNYSNFCLVEGHLTTNFRSASIKLIPKKGDLTSIKNWRPISLLSNLYKILSRAINARLNSIVNRICSRAQKGFNSQRYTQEVLINVLETIRFCNTNGINGALVAVDMAKAFDTLSHHFLREVFRFFGMGPRIIEWLTLLGENRQACILLDNGTYSRNFSLGRGRAQGDNISPNTFNFAEQILIFKLELDPAFAGINRNFQIPPEMPINDSSFFMYESGGETSRNESLADDNTTLLLMTEFNLHHLRNILNNFGSISGLICNFDKTVVMPIGTPNAAVKSYAGFSLCDSVKLLGMPINNELNNTDDIFISLGEKILNLTLFWSRFKLTLSGRIAILKTLLLPQINYLGCFLTPSRIVIDGLQRMLDAFALDNIPCAASRRYLPPEKGGLGLVHIGTFLMAQKCAWVNRAYKQTIDNWRLTLKTLSPSFDTTLIRLVDVKQEENPIIFNLVEAYHVFTNCYTKIGRNFSVVPIFCNPFFVRSRHDNNLLDNLFFGKTFFANYKPKIRALTFADCFIDNNYKSMIEFRDMGLPVTQALWLRLRSALLLAREKCNLKMLNSDVVVPPAKPISEFLNSIKKGSKKFRNVIDKSVYDDIVVTDLTIVKTFCEINSVITPPKVIVEHFLASWNCSFLENNLREFIFKCRNNLLKTNDRLSHILGNIDQNCFLCNCLADGGSHRETFNHFFRTCPVVTNLIAQINANLRITFPVNNFNFDQAFWFGNVCGTLDKNTLLFFDILRYHLWCCKLQRVYPRADVLKERICSTLATIFRIKPSIKNAFRNNLILSNILQATG